MRVPARVVVLLPLIISWGPVEVTSAEELKPARNRLQATRDRLRERLDRALESESELDYLETPLSDIVGDLESIHEIPIQFDHSALEDLVLDQSVPVTRQLSGLPLATALELLLNDFDLTYMNYDGVLLITSQERAEESAIVHVYDVSPLIEKLPVSQVQRRCQPSCKHDNGERCEGYSTIRSVDRLASIIQTVVEPDSWKRQDREPGQLKRLAIF